MSAAAVGVTTSASVVPVYTMKEGSAPVETRIGVYVDVKAQVPELSKHFLISGVVVLETAF